MLALSLLQIRHHVMAHKVEHLVVVMLVHQAGAETTQKETHDP